MANAGAKWKKLGDMQFNQGGGVVNWFPGHMAAATRAIRDRLKLADLVVEVRDARVRTSQSIPISSANGDLQPLVAHKRRVIALNKRDLANPNIMPKWTKYFESVNQDSLSINAHSKNSVRRLLDLVEIKLKEAISREPTLLVMVVGVPNVGKSALINSIHQIALSRFPVQDKMKKAKVGPLPGVTQDIAGYKIAQKPSIYVLDTPGILVPSIPDIETGLKLALAGSVKDSVVGEDRIVQYLLSVLNIRNTPLHWGRLGRCHSSNNGDRMYVDDVAMEVQRALYLTRSEFSGNMEDENEFQGLIETQFAALQKALKVPRDTTEARMKVSKKFLALFRAAQVEDGEAQKYRSTPLIKGRGEQWSESTDGGLQFHG